MDDNVKTVSIGKEENPMLFLCLPVCLPRQSNEHPFAGRHSFLWEG